MSLINGQRQKPTIFDGQCESNVGQFDDDDPRSIRKYLVLLQDCLAIKFVPLVSTSNHHHHQNSFSFPFNNNERINNGSSSNCYNSFDNINKRCSSRCSNRQSNYNGGEDHHHQLQQQQQDYNKLKSNSLSSSGKIGPSLMTAASNAGLSTNGLLTDSSISSTIEVDHSLHHGLHLYKNFREANLKCFWNSTLFEAFQHLEYKGYILPSTLLIWALPRYLATLRTAWSRQILRSPTGFHIEFIGEIEELLADPIQQSQFAPLSDSLCWAILEITSVGQEAFVDSILMALTRTFPTMVPPAKELIYTTLEKLIKEKKVYQTSHGYFVVTPDTFRYMVSSGGNSPAPAIATMECNHYSTIGNAMSVTTSTMPLDALLSSTPAAAAAILQDQHDPEPLSFSRNSWDSENSSKNSPGTINNKNGTSSDEIESNPKSQLRRHNSLKVIRQRDSSLDGRMTNQDFIKDKTRSMSFRLYKSKSIPHTLKGENTKVDKLSKEMEKMFKKESKSGASNKGNKVETDENSKTGKTSFFRKLFKRSTVKKSDNKSSQSLKSSTSSASTQTQTPPSYNIKIAEPEFSSIESDVTTLIIPQINTSTPKHFTLDDRLLTTENNIIQNQQHAASFNSRSNSLPRRPGSRLSMSTLNDENHLYSTPSSNNNNNAFGNNASSNGQLLPFHESNGKSRFQSFGGSSRCSTLSQGTSLGYASQGPNSLGFMSSQSPSPSLSPSGIYSTLNHHQNRNNGTASLSSATSSPIKISQPYNHLLPSSKTARSYGSYRNYYDYYRRRYPPYGSTTLQQQQQQYRQPSSSSSLNNENANKTIIKLQQPLPQQAESNKTTTQQLQERNNSNNGNNVTTISSSTSNRISPFMNTTTTVTQNVKSTTNMELEFSLPLGKSTSTMSTRKVQLQPTTTSKSIINNNNENTKMNVNMSCTPQKSTTKFIIGQPIMSNNNNNNNETTTTEVKTTINHNGTIETHFDYVDPYDDEDENCNNNNNKAVVAEGKKKVSHNKHGSSSLTSNEYSKTNGKFNEPPQEKVIAIAVSNGNSTNVVSGAAKDHLNGNSNVGLVKKRPVPPVMLKCSTSNNTKENLNLNGFGNKQHQLQPPVKVTDFVKTSAGCTGTEAI